VASQTNKAIQPAALVGAKKTIVGGATGGISMGGKSAPGGPGDIPNPENGQNYIEPGKKDTVVPYVPPVQPKSNIALVAGLAAAIGALMLLK
jgi:hypothetical protein